MHLLDICIYDEGLRRIIEMGKVPSSLRNALAKIVSGLACYTRLDLALSWIFDRLENWPSTENSISEINRDREWKKWLLRLLKQVIFESYINIMVNLKVTCYGRFSSILRQTNSPIDKPKKWHQQFYQASLRSWIQWIHLNIFLSVLIS